jgi:CheY-like chemotaxis protein
MEKTDKVILLVEDNEDDVFLMKRAFKGAGILNPIQVVHDGEAVVRYLSGEGEFADREKCPFPSVVFLDLKLPYLSGLEVLKWKSEQPELPPVIFIVVTSSNEPTDLKTAYRLGASSYIVKPPTSEQLLEIIKAFRLYWLTCNSFPENRQL